MSAAAFIAVVALAGLGFFASILLFLRALCMAARDADEAIAEQAAHKRDECRQLEAMWGLPARAPGWDRSRRAP